MPIVGLSVPTSIIISSCSNDSQPTDSSGDINFGPSINPQLSETNFLSTKNFRKKLKNRVNETRVPAYEPLFTTTNTSNPNFQQTIKGNFNFVFDKQTKELYTIVNGSSTNPSDYCIWFKTLNWLTSILEPKPTEASIEEAQYFINPKRMIYIPEFEQLYMYTDKQLAKEDPNVATKYKEVFQTRPRLFKIDFNNLSIDDTNQRFDIKNLTDYDRKNYYDVKLYGNANFCNDFRNIEKNNLVEQLWNYRLISDLRCVFYYKPNLNFSEFSTLSDVLDRYILNFKLYTLSDLSLDRNLGIQTLTNFDYFSVDILVIKEAFEYFNEYPNAPGCFKKIEHELTYAVHVVKPLKMKDKFLLNKPTFREYKETINEYVYKILGDPNFQEITINPKIIFEKRSIFDIQYYWDAFNNCYYFYYEGMTPKDLIFEPHEVLTRLDRRIGSLICLQPNELIPEYRCDDSYRSDEKITCKLVFTS